ncbi:TolB-like 6-bladed beta-propeller domain-containing protein [Roseivirga misakiensis]|uniref:TolB-like 6-blade propeller-like n=1 Tax=Roseivirga misakiensis TaxID=1563681 RepID=A0A1E5T4Q2_9BACT|nr:hypothetical protein [Roseivirga misakiensis]OEK06336.1 hypothetical protein BFP71_01275 [Roseivirga misakiensis]
MKKIIEYLLLLLIISVCACKKESKVIQPTTSPFDTTIEVLGLLDTLLLTENILSTAGFVSTSDILFSTSNNSTPIIKAFDYSGKYLGGFGKKGEGPGEFNRVNGANFNRIGNDIVASSSEFVRRYGVTMGPNGLQVEVKVEKKIPGFYRPINDIFMINDSTFGGVVGFTHNEYSTFTINGDTSSFGDFLDLEPEVPRTAYSDLYQSRTASKPDKGKVVSAYTRFPFLKIENLITGTSKVVEVLPENQQKPIEIGPYKMGLRGLGYYSYFQSLEANDDFIISIYQEKSFEKVDPPTNTGNLRSVPLTERKSYIFDWDGNPILALKIEEWMQVYTITPDNRIIFFHPEQKDELYVLDLISLIDSV